MNRKNSLLIGAIAIVAMSLAYLQAQIRTAEHRIARKEHCIPTFADGDGPYYLPNAPFRTKLSSPDSKGEKLVITGKLLQNDCFTTIPNAIIDIWHASEEGSYDNVWYRGQIYTENDGTYKFETIVPKGYGEGTAHRPPHIHFKVRIKNALIITSEMFFPEVAGTPGFKDAFIMKEDIKNEEDHRVHYGFHDIVLP